MNVMTLDEIVFHILQQGCSEGTSSFETLDQATWNISKDIDVATKKFRTQKWKELEQNPKKWRSLLKLEGMKSWKKRLQL